MMSAMTVNAQVWLGGSVGYTSDENDHSGFAISPEVGYNISKNFSAAIALSYVQKGYNGANDDSFSIKPYARYIFAHKSMVSLFVDGGIEYLDKNKYGGSTYSVMVEPGISLAISDKVSLVAKTGLFRYDRIMREEDYDTNACKLAIDGTDLKFGVYYTF